MKVTITLRKEIADLPDAKRLYILVTQRLEDIPELQTTIHAALDESEINGAPD